MTENEQETSLVRELAAPLHEARPWIRVIALVFVVSGGAAIVGIIVAWAAIVMGTWKTFRFAEAIVPLGIGTLAVIGIAQLFFLSGISLLRSTAANEAAKLTGQKEKLVESLDQMQTFFKTIVVLCVLQLLLAVVSIAGGYSSLPVHSSGPISRQPSPTDDRQSTHPLCDLHPEVDGGGARPGVQHSRCPAGIGRGVRRHDPPASFTIYPNTSSTAHEKGRHLAATARGAIRVVSHLMYTALR
jgi:hypothetical protein